MATRLIRLDDAPLLAELLALNRQFLAPWEPTRPDEQCTADGQRRQIEDALERHAADDELPHVILEHGSIVGRTTLSNVVRGPFQSCNLGNRGDVPKARTKLDRQRGRRALSP